MEFNLFHRDYFNAKNGAFSKVTEREHIDSQITLTDIEAEIVINHFGKQNIQVGNVKSDPRKATKNFLLYPSFNSINLNLVFPKPNKTELRIYLSKEASYKPLGGDIWFIYETLNSELVIGSIEEKSWNSIGQFDSLDENYQEEIEDVLSTNTFSNVSSNGKITITTVDSKTIYQRDPRIAIMRFQTSNYQCEINPLHKTFISERTNRPYMEAHHFIPIKFQPNFQIPLDNFDNIISLCPNCHRGIHHAIIEQKLHLINSIYNKRTQLHNYSLEDIAQFYNCLKDF